MCTCSSITLDLVHVCCHRNKECPTCRQKLVSKRSLRPDKNIDELISKLYPHRDMDVEVQVRTVGEGRGVEGYVELVQYMHHRVVAMAMGYICRYNLYVCMYLILFLWDIR